MNAQFPVPLSFSETRSIARSISKWVWRRFTPAAFREVQAARGHLKGAGKRDCSMSQALVLIGEGKSHREVARIIGVDHKTVANWIRRTMAEQ